MHRTSIFVFLAILLVFGNASVLMTVEVWEQWDTLSQIEQLAYILEPYEKEDLEKEYQEFGQARLADVQNACQEFQDENVLEAFFFQCDTDEDRQLSIDEYMICRGEHDKYGNPSTLSEWNIRADLILSEFEDEMYKVGSNGQGEVNMDTILLDSDGIIID